MMPGTPMASKHTSGLPPPARVHASKAGSVGRVDDLGGAHRGGERPAGGREVGGDDGVDALELQRADHGQPDRAAAEHERALAGLRCALLFTAWRPTAIGSVSAACRKSRPFGHLERASAPRAACARRSRRRRRCCRRSARTPPIGVSRIGIDVTSVPAAGATVSGPDLEHLGRRTRGPCTRRWLEVELGGPVAHDRHAAHLLAEREHRRRRAWRSAGRDPQMPHAFTCTSTCAEAGRRVGHVVLHVDLCRTSEQRRAVSEPPRSSEPRNVSRAALTSSGASCCTQWPAPVDDRVAAVVEGVAVHDRGRAHEVHGVERCR